MQGNIHVCVCALLAKGYTNAHVCSCSTSGSTANAQVPHALIRGYVEKTGHDDPKHTRTHIERNFGASELPTPRRSGPGEKDRARARSLAIAAELCGEGLDDQLRDGHRALRVLPGDELALGSKGGVNASWRPEQGIARQGPRSLE